MHPVFTIRCQGDLLDPQECALIWGPASQRGHGPSPLGGEAQCQLPNSLPGPGLTHPAGHL